VSEFRLLVSGYLYISFLCPDFDRILTGKDRINDYYIIEYNARLVSVKSTQEIVWSSWAVYRYVRVVHEGYGSAKYAHINKFSLL